MDFTSFFPNQQFAFSSNGVVPLHATFTEESQKMSSAGGTGHSEVYDHSAIFQTPYEPFRFDAVIESPEITELSMSVPPDESGLPPRASTHQDGTESNKSDNNLRMDRRSSSDDNHLTPAQSRRKAQNRAAQRAFRERKERHVKELETKLSALESSATSLASDNQRLKLALQRAMTENELLRATSGAIRGGGPPIPTVRTREFSPVSPGVLGDDGEAGPLDISLSSYGDDSENENAETGAMLTTSQVWDYLVEHPLVKSGRVDITDTVDRLRGAARQSGRGGPIFCEKEIRKAIENSRRAGGDALI